MEAHTCLGDVQRAIWHSWYDPVQGTLVFVKSALMTLIYMEKLASRKALLN